MVQNVPQYNFVTDNELARKMWNKSVRSINDVSLKKSFFNDRAATLFICINIHLKEFYESEVDHDTGLGVKFKNFHPNS